MGTLLATVLLAIYPNCHRFKECGSYFISNDVDEHFIEDSPDGLIACTEQCMGSTCRNPLDYPIGRISVEIKCPYSPITTPTLLPVSYMLPHYNACQILMHMRATETDILLFVSASPDSMAVSLVDFHPNMWDAIFEHANDLYHGTNCSKPTDTQPASNEIKSLLKEYCDNNSILIAEVPMKKIIDDGRLAESPMIDENLNMYRERAQNLPSIVNWKKINDEIVNLCDDTVSLLNKSNNILQRKATEILLFLITDTDREFQKELPISVPIAYGMKGKSIRLDTARKMMNVVRDELKEHNCNVLVEALDGQWAGLIFRDEIKNPLMFYELDKDCWQKFSLKSKIGVMTLMEHFSFVFRKAFGSLQ